MSVTTHTPPDTPQEGPLVRIGELSRRTGVGADTLRAWERRYGLLRPSRSEGGFRLYGRGDEDRVRAMKALIDSGVSAREAARQAAVPVAAAPRMEAVGLADPAASLRGALERFDDAGANAVLDEVLARLTLEAAAERVVLPVMRELGVRWERGEVSVAQEHFATGVVRARLLALARNWGAGAGPMALLACPPGEQHDFGLLVFGLVLRSRGWRITYLGPDTPVETLARAAEDLRPSAIVLAALSPRPLEACAAEIGALSGSVRVLVGGEVDPELAERLGAAELDHDPVAAARALAASG